MRTKNNSIIFTMIIALIVFILVTFVFTTKHGYTYDPLIMDWINTVTTPALEQVMSFISVLGSSEVILIITLVIAALLALKRNWIFTLFFLTVSVGGVALNFALKMLFQRERPGGEVKLIEVFNFSFEIPSYSFPSGHTMRITILLLFLIYLSHRFLKRSSLKALAYLAGVLIMIGVALSRLFLEAHFLSDTIGAMSISVVWFCLCLLFFKKFQRQEPRPMYRPF